MLAGLGLQSLAKCEKPVKPAEIATSERSTGHLPEQQAGPGRPWKALEGPGRPWKALEGPGRPWKASGGLWRPLAAVVLAAAPGKSPR
jgi:hypothetical protein